MTIYYSVTCSIHCILSMYRTMLLKLNLVWKLFQLCCLTTISGLPSGPALQGRTGNSPIFHLISILVSSLWWFYDLTGNGDRKNENCINVGWKCLEISFMTVLSNQTPPTSDVRTFSTKFHEFFHDFVTLNSWEITGNVRPFRRVFKWYFRYDMFIVSLKVFSEPPITVKSSYHFLNYSNCFLFENMT